MSMDVDDIMRQVNDIENNSQSYVMNGTLNAPFNDSDIIVKVGTIDDGTVETYRDKNTGETVTKEGTNIIVVEKTSATGKKYHRVFAEIGFLTPAQAGKNYQMSGSMKVNCKYDHQMYATQKEGTSEKTGKPYKFISLALYENDGINKNGKDVSDPSIPEGTPF